MKTVDKFMRFFEELPEKCPPAEAADQAHPSVFRFVPAADVSRDHFLSHAALGKFLPKVDPCVLAACSLFSSTDCPGFKKASKLPKFKKSKIAELSLPQGAGESVTDKSGHINFWMYSHFDPVAAVVRVF